MFILLECKEMYGTATGLRCVPVTWEVRIGKTSSCVVSVPVSSENKVATTTKAILSLVIPR